MKSDFKARTPITGVVRWFAPTDFGRVPLLGFEVLTLERARFWLYQEFVDAWMHIFRAHRFLEVNVEYSSAWPFEAPLHLI